MGTTVPLSGATSGRMPPPRLDGVCGPTGGGVAYTERRARAAGRTGAPVGRMVAEAGSRRAMRQHGAAARLPRACRPPAGPPSGDAAPIACAPPRPGDPRGARERLLPEALADRRHRAGPSCPPELPRRGRATAPRPRDLGRPATA